MIIGAAAHPARRGRRAGQRRGGEDGGRDGETARSPLAGVPRPCDPGARRGDEEVFGAAWPLIVEWRELKNAHPVRGKGFAWLADHERLLEMELALLEEHGMTLPPEKQPLRGFDRGRADQLAENSALRHAEGAVVASASAEGDGGRHVRPLAEVVGIPAGVLCERKL